MRNDDTGNLPTPPEIERQLALQYMIRRRVFVIAIVALTVLNLAVAGISLQTLHVLGGAVADAPDRTERILLVIDCRRQADLEILAAELDLTVQLVDPRCGELPEELLDGQ